MKPQLAQTTLVIGYALIFALHHARGSLSATITEDQKKPDTKENTMAKIEKIFRCRVDYDVDRNFSDDEMASEKITTKALQWPHTANVEADSHSAGPAWNAYLVFESNSESAVRKVDEKVERYILRFRSAKILD